MLVLFIRERARRASEWRLIDMNEVMEILQSINGNIDYANEDRLIDKGLFVSFDIIQVVTECEERFDIEIPAEMIVPQNFQSAEAIWNMVNGLIEGSK